MKLKNLLPYERYKLITTLSEEEVKKRLAENIEPEKLLRYSSWGKSSLPYEGYIANDHFAIKRVINYRNSFLPNIEGDIYSDYGNTHISIAMKLDPLVLAFGCVWMGGVLFVCLLMICGLLINIGEVGRNGFSPAALVPFGMLFFGAGLFYSGFKTESRKSKEFLAALLETKETAPGQ